MELSRDRFSDWKQIGKGSNGVVFSARDTQLGIDVAIKRVGSTRGHVGIWHEEWLNRIVAGKDEMSALKSLQCKYVPKFYGYWQELNQEDVYGKVDRFGNVKPLVNYTYIVQGLVEGELLEKIVKRLIRKSVGKAPIPAYITYVNAQIEYQELVWKILGQVIEATAIFQDRGWSHQDLSTSNIFWIKPGIEASDAPEEKIEGKIVIVDFGCADTLSVCSPDNIVDLIFDLTWLDCYSPGTRGMGGEETYTIRIAEYLEEGINLSPIMKDILMLMIMMLKDHRNDNALLLRLYRELDTQ